jgi:hypothetical protein
MSRRGIAVFLTKSNRLHGRITSVRRQDSGSHYEASRSLPLGIARDGELEMARPEASVQTLGTSYLALTLAHLVRCAAAILCRAAADIVRFFGVVPELEDSFSFAHRAR